MQEAKFAAAEHGYTAMRYQQEVGAGYFDNVMMTLAQGQASTTMW